MTEHCRPGTMTSSWRLDLIPHILPGQENQLTIRLDNSNHSSWGTRVPEFEG